MNILQLIQKQAALAFKSSKLPANISTSVKTSTRADFGHYQINGVMAAAKELKIPPHSLAKTVISNLDLSDIAEKIEIAGPGFINIFLKKSWLSMQLDSALTSNRLNVSQCKKANIVVVDYSGPNLAKEMHVGHLRSTIIGDAMARLLSFIGDNVIRQNHVGDWGTQFGMLIAHMVDQQKHGSDITHELEDLEVFYREAKQRFDEDKKFAEKSRDYVVKLQSGDPQCQKLWEKFIAISLEHCNKIYKKLHVNLSNSDVKPESSYNSDLPIIIETLNNKGILKESEGAKVVFLDEMKNKKGKPYPVIVQKSDGGYLYATTDLAALKYRSKILSADRMMYFVDARQSMHLNSVFIIAKKAGLVEANTQIEHLPFGTMMGKDGRPFKTRDGGTVKLIDLLNEAEDRAYTLVSEKNPELPKTERKNIAHKVGIAAVKYADLSKNRTSDYIFDWDTMLNFEGNTAPYLQYAYTRIQSILRKIESLDNKTKIILTTDEELSLAVTALQVEEVIYGIRESATPNILCNYLYKLSSKFMSFYEVCPVLNADNPTTKNSRLKLVKVTGKTLKIGLDILGIETMERM